MNNVNKGLQQANTPVYGQAQVSQYMGGLNNLANSAIQNLQANLARSGALNSGRNAQGITDINTAKMGDTANFMSQIPLLNRQAQMQQQLGFGGLGQGILASAPRSSTFNQTGTGTNASEQVQTMSPSLMSQLFQGIQGGAGLASAFMGMPMFGGGGGGGGNTFTPPSNPFDWGAPPTLAPSGGGGIPPWLLQAGLGG